ncbi:phosphoribosylglycinamide formyltransferase [Bacillus sp. RG28]|uniref:Phosphoribosylglycinamide formyltransferase n=1 Tax=Gottfriedia endophytica TaxID=2820819 RepID=A0A940NPM1_9BACI|nr:phosphoribosylglycinamide formyltransferase [Gottfriedia endophytica]MBP0725999.1 phosphoribosylglycinamide formyltransferase [Gottfriedia endophytica]
MTNLAVFASGNGSNFQAIINAINANELRAKICLLVCDKRDAYSIERAKQAGIPTFVFTAKEYESKAAYEQEIVTILQENKVDLIALAGFMRLIGPTLLEAFRGKIVNIHPSFLPLFPGKDAVGQALHANVEKTGVTVHFVDEGMDTGPIISQQEIDITLGETRESLEKKIHDVEHELYVKTLQSLIHI